MTRYKKEGYRKSQVDDRGFRTSSPVYIKNNAKLPVPFAVGLLVVNFDLWKVKNDF